MIFSNQHIATVSALKNQLEHQHSLISNSLIEESINGAKVVKGALKIRLDHGPVFLKSYDSTDIKSSTVEYVTNSDIFLTGKSSGYRYSMNLFKFSSKLETTKSRVRKADYETLFKIIKNKYDITEKTLEILRLLEDPTVEQNNLSIFVKVHSLDHKIYNPKTEAQLSDEEAIEYGLKHSTTRQDITDLRIERYRLNSSSSYQERSCTVYINYDLNIINDEKRTDNHASRIVKLSDAITALDDYLELIKGASKY